MDKEQQREVIALVCGWELTGGSWGNNLLGTHPDT